MVTITLIICNVLIYLVTASKTGYIQTYGLIPSRVINDKEYYRLLTCMFLHGNMYHIFMNMYGLYGLGSYVEQKIGSMKYLIIYVLIGIMTSYASVQIRSMAGKGNIASIGASGALYGLFGMCMAQMIKTTGFHSALSYNRSTLIVLILMFFVPGIDNYAHICGLLIGIIAGMCVM